LLYNQVTQSQRFVQNCQKYRGFLVRNRYFTRGVNHYQLSVISYQLSVISYQLSVIRFELSVIRFELSVISYQLSVISYQLSGLSFQLVVSSGKFGAFFSLITDYCLLFTVY
jgi:hypothetical protein